jgi:hypothetical protein
MKDGSGKDSGGDGEMQQGDSNGSAARTNMSLKIAAEKRAERLRAELRANLARRKLQARARREGAEDERPGKLLANDDASGNVNRHENDNPGEQD